MASENTIVHAPGGPSTTSDAIAPMTGRERASVAVLLVVHAVLCWLQRIPAITLQDDAAYLWLARSLRGLQYVDVYLPSDVVHAQYPPVYPALLATVSAIAGERIDALVLVSLVASVGGLALVHLAARVIVGPWLSLGALTLLALSPGLTANGGMIMSEATFLFFVALALYGLARAERGARWGTVLGGLGVFAGAFVRSAGAPLVAAYVAYLALRRRWTAAAVATVLLLAPVVAWNVWSLSRPPAPYARSYASDAVLALGAADSLATSERDIAAGSLPERVFQSAKSYARDGLPTALNLPTVPGTAVDNVAWLLVNVAALGTGLVLFARRWPVAPLFLLGYGALLLAWSWALPRFLEPVLPLLVVTWLAGAAAISARMFRRAWAIPAVLLAIVGTFSVVGQVRLTRSALACNRSAPLDDPACFSDAQRGFFAAVRDIAADTSSGRVIGAAKPATAAWYSGKRVFPASALPYAERDALLGVLAEYGVRRIVVGRTHGTDLRAARTLVTACDMLMVRASYPGDTWVFEVRTPGSDHSPEEETESACAVLRRRVKHAADRYPAGRW